MLSCVPVEKLTPERRRQQTRDALIAAATEVFARRGFEGAALEEIAETAGFTRGAIYKNFDGKEDLFFAVTDRLNEQIIEAFRAIAPAAAGPDAWDISRLADLWRASVERLRRPLRHRQGVRALRAAQPRGAVREPSPTAASNATSSPPSSTKSPSSRA